MHQTLEMLEKKENLLVKKANLEVEKAKTFTKAKNKRGILYQLQEIHWYFSFLLFCSFWSIAIMMYHHSKFNESIADNVVDFDFGPILPYVAISTQDY